MFSHEKLFKKKPIKKDLTLMTSSYLVLHFKVFDQDNNSVHAQVDFAVDDVENFLNVFGLQKTFLKF